MKSKCELIGGPMDGAVYAVEDIEQEIYIEVPTYPASVFKKVDIHDPANYKVKVVGYNRIGANKFKYEGLK